MKTVNSLSGGPTSSYIAVHYPADIEVFALCCIDNHNAGKGIDKTLMQMANDKLQKYSSHWPEFVATSEDPIILKTMFDLEQMLGREIIWLRGMGWEDMIRYQQAIPNIAKRFCTTILKMWPIFYYLYMYHELPVQMRIGYRYDEKERAETSNNVMRFTTECRYAKVKKFHKWQEMVWRVGQFPLIDDKILHPHIRKYWSDKDIEFPKDSNCQNCFWKAEQQLRKNYDTNPHIMKWAAVMEALYDRTFKEKYSLLEIKNLGLQLDFLFGTGAGCQAGFCTD
ncbi:hypothetical protein [Arcticibacter sp.]|uniref:hypothetical protein n=1 Tax=Arcticibacter sp. TaxID=1872630 RepID=UPI00388EDE3E